MGVARAAAARNARAAAGGADGRIRRREDHRGSLAAARPPRSRPYRRKASRSASAQAGWFGSAGLRSRSAAFSSSSTRSKPACSGRACASSSAACLPRRWWRPVNGHADARSRSPWRRCRQRTSRAFSPPPAPPSPTRRSTPLMRSTASSCPAPPSYCSASWRSRRWRLRCCMGPRSPRSVRSARSSRRCSSPAIRRTTGRSTSISRSSPPPRSRSPRAAVALACDHGGGVRHALDVPRSQRHDRRRIDWSACVPRRRRLCAGRCASGVRTVLWPGRRAGRDRSGLFDRARRVPVCRDPAGARVEARWGRACRLHADDRRHGRHRVAHRGRDRRAPCRRRVRVPDDGQLGRQYRLQDAARARRPGRSSPEPEPRALRHAPRARLRLHGAVRRVRLPRAGPLGEAARADHLGCDRSRGAARDPDRTLSPHLRVRPLAAVRRARAADRRAVRVRDRAT